MNALELNMKPLKTNCTLGNLKKLLLNKFGYELVNYGDFYDEHDLKIVKLVLPFTMVFPLRLLSVCAAVEHVSRNSIPGHWVECGVRDGGASMAAAYKFQQFGLDKHLWLYDLDMRESVANLNSTGIDDRRVFPIKGDILNTLPRHAPEKVSILRLDTNTYETTLHEMIHLYPRLQSNGILLMDDYSIPEFRKAIHDYFSNSKISRPFISRSDYTGAIIVKP